MERWNGIVEWWAGLAWAGDKECCLEALSVGLGSSGGSRGL